jgi:hypothetical protein
VKSWMRSFPLCLSYFPACFHLVPWVFLHHDRPRILTSVSTVCSWNFVAGDGTRGKEMQSEGWHNGRTASFHLKLMGLAADMRFAAAAVDSDEYGGRGARTANAAIWV